MTLTHINPDTDPTDALVGRIVAEIQAAIAKPDLSAVHEVIREAGIRNARRKLAEAPDRLAEAQASFREAQGREALAKESYAQALLEAEWEVDGNLHKDGNKTYRWVDCECGGAVKDCAICAGAGQFRKFMLADDVKAYKASEAAKVPAVVVVAAELRRCEMDTAAARDAVTVAEKRLSACRADLEAAVAELNALAVGLATRGA
jgi:hypothetical protein